jgi:hypothetical protein
MEGPIIALVALVVSFLAFDLAATGWGVDSRPSMTDDHQR